MTFKTTIPAENADLVSKEMRDNQVAAATQNSGAITPPTLLGMLHYDTTDPANHKIKTFNGTTYITLFENVNTFPVVPSNITKVAVDLPSGSSSYVINHGLGTSDLIVQVLSPKGPPGILVAVDIQITDDNNVTIDFAVALASDARLILIG